MLRWYEHVERVEVTCRVKRVSINGFDGESVGDEVVVAIWFYILYSIVSEVLLPVGMFTKQGWP